MKTLSADITSRGFRFIQIAREGNIAIYSQHLKGNSGAPLAYETIIIKSHNGYTLGGTYIEPAEIYPSAESFGTLGWSYSSLMTDAKERAVAKMNELIRKKAKVT